MALDENSGTKEHIFCAFYRGTVRLFFALIAAWLFVGCLVSTGYVFTKEAAVTFEGSCILPDSVWLQCAFFSLMCLLAVSASKRRLPRFPENAGKLRRLRIFLIGAAGMLALLWVICMQALPNADGKYVQVAASDFSDGEIYLFETGSYMYYYPHQAGLFLLHLALQKINPDTTLPFQMLNVLCYVGILYCLGELALELGLGDAGCLTATCLGILFLPLLLYVTFVYGNLPGLFFSMAALVQSIRFHRDGKWPRALWAALLVLLAVTVKPNYQIFAIGLLLYTLYNGLRGKKHCWLLLVLLLISWLAADQLPILLVEKWTGCSLHNGIPPAAWLAMGLRTDSRWGPGWYSNYLLDTYFTAKMDPKIQNSMVIDSISGILQGYLMDPLSAIRFFVTKNATQWSDPLFQCIWTNIKMFREGNQVIPQWTVAFLSAEGRDLFGWFLNLLQTFVYGGLVLWAWVPTFEKRKSQEDLLAVILVGGFVFHTFWEAKSRYTMPYVVLILPLALLGYKRLALLAQDRDAKALWQSPAGKLRFLMPVLLMVLALVLSAVLAAPLNSTLQELQQTV